MQVFLSAFDDVPDPRASNAHHEFGELLVTAFVLVLCGASSCAEMAAFGRAKESLFRGFLKLKHAIPTHDTFSAVFQMIDPKALDAAFGNVLADVAALQHGHAVLMMTLFAPMISRRLRDRSPIFVVAPSRCLPPVECCRGVRPSKAAKSWALRKFSGGGARVAMAVAISGPMPGTVIRRRANSFSTY